MTDRNKLKPRRSYTANSVPVVSGATPDIERHEIAINWADAKLFTRDGSDQLVSITLGGGGGGSGSGSSSLVYAATPGSFPTPGSTANLYIATDSRKLFGWDSTNSVYVELGPVGGGSQALQVTIPASDPFFSNVLLLLHGNGSLADSSGYGRTLTANGNVAATASAKYGSASISLDGTGDYLSLSHPDFAWGAVDYTLEAWVWLNNYGDYGSWFSNYISNGSLFGVSVGVTNTGLPFLMHPGGFNITGSTPMPTGQWVHAMVTRSSNLVTYYIDGTSVGTVFTSGSHAQADVVIGRVYLDLNVGYWPGRIDELRVTRGAARAVVVPTAAYPDMTPQVIQVVPAT